jgi:hypothetical protein
MEPDARGRQILSFHNMAAQDINGETAITQMAELVSLKRETDFDGVSNREMAEMNYEDFWRCWGQRERNASRFARRGILAEQLGYLQMAKEARLNRGADAQDDRVIDELVEECATFEESMSIQVAKTRKNLSDDSFDDLSNAVRMDVRSRRLSIWDMIVRRDEEGSHRQHRHEIAQARDESIKVAQAEAARLVQLEREEEDRIGQIKLDRIAKQESIRSQTHCRLMVLLDKSSHARLSSEEEDCVDLLKLDRTEDDSGSVAQLAKQSKAQEEDSKHLQIDQGKDDQEGIAGLSSLQEYKILPAKLALQDGPKARRCRQDASRRIYDPGGQLVV